MRMGHFIKTCKKIGKVQLSFLSLLFFLSVSSLFSLSVFFFCAVSMFPAVSEIKSILSFQHNQTDRLKPKERDLDFGGGGGRVGVNVETFIVTLYFHFALIFRHQ